jgi:hypothetical protein
MDLRSCPISQRWASALLIPAAIVALCPALSAQSEEDSTYMGENPDGYASVRLLDGAATIRKGDVEEPLSRGIPIAEGDVVESHGRGILQLADGTRVAFGPDTSFQVATLLGDHDRERQVLLRLDYGRLRINSGRESDAQIRVDTASGSAIAQDGATIDIEAQQDRVVRAKVLSGRMTFLNERDRTSLAAGERLTVYSDQDRLDRIQNFNTYGGDAFDGWCDRNMQARRGPSWDKVPQELRYYSEDLDAHGEWVYVDEYRSWCWRPVRVASEWRPYWQGHWGAYPGGMTWVSDEPWGYVTYHHGRWGWNVNLGWFWIPGVYYAPAWVAWQSDDLYFGWAPMGYYNAPVAWGFGVWAGGFCWNVIDVQFIFSRRVHDHIHHERGPVHRFDPGPGRPGGGGGPHPPRWHQGPLPVSPGEFRNPPLFRHVIQDPKVMRDRLRTYEQRTGRVVYRQTPPTGQPMPPTSQPSAPRGFEDPGRLPHRIEPPQGRKGAIGNVQAPDQGKTPGATAPQTQPGRKPVPIPAPTSPNSGPRPSDPAPNTQPGRNPLPVPGPTVPNKHPWPDGGVRGNQPAQPGRKPVPIPAPTSPNSAPRPSGPAPNVQAGRNPVPVPEPTVPNKHPGPDGGVRGNQPAQPSRKPVPIPAPTSPNSAPGPSGPAQYVQPGRNPVPGGAPKAPDHRPETGGQIQKPQPGVAPGGGGGRNPGGSPPPPVWPKPQKPSDPRP